MNNWDDLRYFLAVARSKTLSSAATTLNVDATTVGRRLERLSESLNSSLFETGSGGQTLTASGEALLRYAEDVERNIVSANAMLSGERSRLTGTVRISLSEGFASWIVARHLPAFRDLHPGIRLETVTTNGFLNPSKREADLAVMLARPVKGPLVARKLTDYTLGLYASNDYVGKHGQPESVPELSSHTLIGYIPDFIYAEELRYLGEVNDSLSPEFSSSSINAQYAMTRSGLGIAILPHFIGRQVRSLAQILQPRVRISRSFWIVVHRDLQRVARVRAVIDWLDDITRQEAKLFD
jgi:DNA-binding transcriptional LysR family regulator